MGNAHGLGDLDKRAIVEVKFVSLLQLVAVLVVCIAEEVPCLIVDHDPAVEGVELEIAILPPLLLSLDILGEEATELGNGRAVLGGSNGSDGRGVLSITQRSRHRVDSRLRRVVVGVGDMEAGSGRSGKGSAP